jgi:putative membrane-bound dehydrogenase-like protein
VRNSPATENARTTLALLFCLFFSFTAGAEPAFELPDGFKIQRATAPGAVKFPMFACFDERGKMFVAESSGLDLYDELQKLTRKCRIRALEDKDGDGLFEKAEVFADGLVFPMGLVWREGKLYVADPPELVALEDTNGDGRADKRTLILKEFGHLDNGSLHGLTFGPDGWLYMTMGRPDGYRFQKPDGSVLEGKSGALIRCRPDGSDVEVVARGFENLVEVVFMPGGEIVGTDNWFSLPVDGIRDALVHLVEGGLYPLQVKDAGTKFFQPVEPLPPIRMYPAVAHSGLMRYQGKSFPPGMRNNLFSAQFNTRKVVRHAFTTRGSTFASADSDFLTTDDPDFHPSDVLEGADGSVYVVDTGSWYVHHCPTGRIRNTPAEGGIYRVNYDQPTRIEDAWGESLSWENASSDELFKRARDSRPAVRARAMEKLVKTRPRVVDEWRKLIASEFQEDVLWALARINTEWAQGEIRQLLETTNEATVVLAARVLGRIANKEAAGKLEKLLQHENPRVRFAAAESLAHCGSHTSVPLLVLALVRESDAFLEHAIIYSLHRLSTVKEQLAFLNHEHPRVRKAGLTLLDQAPGGPLEGKDVAKFVFDADEGLSRKARGILAARPEWVEEAGQLVRALLSKTELSANEQTALGQFLPAFGLQPQITKFVSEALSPAKESVSSATRAQLLESIAKMPAGKIPQSWQGEIINCITTGPLPVRRQGILTANNLRLPGMEEAFLAVAEQKDLPSTMRVEALRGLARTRPQLTSAGIELLCELAARTNAPSLRLAAMEVLGIAEMKPNQLAKALRTISGDPLVSPTGMTSMIRRNGVQVDSEQAIAEFLANHPNISDDQFTWITERLSATSRARIVGSREARKKELSAAREKLKEMEPLISGGDFNRGHELFLEKVACVACHRVGKIGGLTGPDLTKIGAIRSGRDLLESLLIPSATFAQGYETFQAKLKDGTELVGVLVRQADAAIVIRDAAGAETRFNPAQMESIARSDVSLMPEGLLNALKPSEIQDLLAYLQSLK